MGLSDTERAMLEFAGRHYAYAAARDDDIRERFDLTPARYWATVNRLIDEPRAEVDMAREVRRLRRVREARRGVRTVHAVHTDSPY